MLQWAFYVLVVSVVLCISGIVAEQALRRRQLATRVVWLAALILCVGLSFHAWPVSSAAPPTASTRQVSTSSVPAVVPIRLPDVTTAAGMRTGADGLAEFEPTRILTITREGEQLFAHGPGDPPLPIYADSQNEFHWKVITASVTFSGNADGLASTATIHQSGVEIVSPRIDDAAAAAVEERFAARIEAQQPQAGGETALRKTWLH